MKTALKDWQVVAYGDSAETRAAINYLRECGWPVDTNAYPERDTVEDRIHWFKAGFRAALAPREREGVWNPNGEGQQPDIPGGNAKDHARAKQPVIAYACLYPKLAAVAREHGYALAMHGSLVADCDLIAVPWVENAASGDDLARALAVAAPGHLILDTYAARPGGVRKHVIHLGGGPYIDLAVCALGAVAPQGGEQ